jgi:hypothetical protein
VRVLVPDVPLEVLDLDGDAADRAFLQGIVGAFAGFPLKIP